MCNETCQLDGCENRLEGMRKDALYCCKKHGDKSRNKGKKLTPEKKAWLKEYRQTPECKAYDKARRLTPEWKAYRKAYNQSPEYKARERERKQTPEYKARQKAYNKARNQTLEIKARDIIKQHERRAKKAALPATLTDADWLSCLEYFDNRCAYCGEPFRDNTPHQEHFIPLNKLGEYTPWNIVCACMICNSSKRDKDPEAWCTPEQYERVVSYLIQIMTFG